MDKGKHLMLLVRNSIFETNSSSTHNFVLGNGDYDIKPFIEPAWNTEFGWQYTTWSSPEEKLAYVIRCLLNGYKWNYNGAERDSWKDEDFIQGEMIVAALKPFKDRCNYLGFDFSYPSVADLELGYIDHESDYKEEIKDLILEDKDLLNFIFNPNSSIEGGNDNEMYF